MNCADNSLRGKMDKICWHARNGRITEEEDLPVGEDEEIPR